MYVFYRERDREARKERNIGNEQKKLSVKDRKKGENVFATEKEGEGGKEVRR